MRSDRDRLHDARAFIEHARVHGGRSGDDLAADLGPAHAAIYALAVIGEALGWLRADVKNLAPEVPWRAVKDMRNRLIHSYWAVDLTIVADVIENELPRLDLALADLQRQLEISDA